MVNRKIYLDYAASAPLDKEVKKAMEPYFGLFENGKFGNPNSLHQFGQETRKAIDKARTKIAELLGCSSAGGFGEIIFTGSATEANNMALRGVIKRIMNNELRIMNKTKIQNSKFIIPRIIVSSIEHESVLATAKDLEREGVEVIYLPVDKNGIVDLKKLKESLNENTVLVSIMYANNETGVIQPINEIAKIIKDFKNQISLNPPLLKGEKTPLLKRGVGEIFSSFNALIYPLFHIDAVQAFQFLNCHPDELGIDLMTLSAHKIYGPKGVGILYVKNYESGIKNYGKEIKINIKDRIQNSIIHNSKFILPILTGGGQEFGLRSGTENVQAIVGFAKAIELADKNREKEFKRIFELKKYFWQELKKINSKVGINGIMGNVNKIPQPPFKKGAKPIIHNSRFITQLPNILNIHFPGFDAGELLIFLDLNGVAVSSGSACASFAAKKSHVLKAMGYSDERINSSLRISFGKFTTKNDLKKALKIFSKINIYGG